MQLYLADAIAEVMPLANRLVSEQEVVTAISRYSTESEREAKLCWLLCVFAAERGYHQPVLEVLEKLDRVPLGGYVLAARSSIQIRKRDFAAAMEGLDKCSSACGLNDVELKSIIAHQRAIAYFHRGKPGEAKKYLYEAMQLIPERHFLRGRILDSLGMLYAQLNDLYAAREFFRCALALKISFADLVGVALTRGQLGRLYLDWGQLEAALAEFMEDKRLCGETGDARGEAQMDNMIGQVYLAKTDWQIAADWLGESVRLCDSGQWSIPGAFARKDWALALLKLDRAQESQTVLDEARHLFLEAGFEEGLAHVDRVQALAQMHCGQFQEAEVASNRSMRWFHRHQEVAQAARSQLQFALARHSGGAPVSIVAAELKIALDWAELARRDLLVQEIEAEMKAIDPVACQTHLYRRVRGRTVETDTSSLVTASLVPGSVIFADVQGSTEFARNLDPGVVLVTVNQLMSSFELALAEHGAIVTTYMGDGFMALVLGADHARRSVDAALAIFSAAHEFNEPRTLLNLPLLNIRVGVSTGEICVGNVGTYRRMDYTAIGTTVNLAARIQSEGEIGLPCICQATHDRLQAELDVKWPAGRTVLLKGLGEVRVWDVVRRR